MASPLPVSKSTRSCVATAGAFRFDLNAALSSVVALEASVSADASTAEALGTNRIGNGVVIGAEGLVLTIGYLITEADEVILTTGDGRRAPAHVLGIDQATGLGLVHALEPLNLPTLSIGDSRSVSKQRRDRPGRQCAHALSGVLLARAPFAGYWEYYLDEALFVGPAHPHWSGAVINGFSVRLSGWSTGRTARRRRRGHAAQHVRSGRAAEIDPGARAALCGRLPALDRGDVQDADAGVVVLDVSDGGPADQAGLEQGDVIRSIGGEKVTDLAGFYRALWALGPPGVTARLVVQRDQQMLSIDIQTVDRTARLKKRRLN